MIHNPQMTALASLVQSADAGGYTLPADVTDAYRVVQKLQQTTLPEPRTFDSSDAAQQILRAVAAGDRVDPLDLCRDAIKVQDEHRLHTEAAAALTLATNQAASAAVTTAGDAADRIITEHLQPAFEELLARVREVAEILRPHIDAEFQINRDGVIAASSTKVRATYLELPALVERHRTLRQARDRANSVGARVLQRDANGMFASFASPLAFHPAWRHPAPVPPLPAPTDPASRLLWTVSDQAVAARPWLPTAAEQDAAWWEVFGPHVERRMAGMAIASSGGVHMNA